MKFKALLAAAALSVSATAGFAACSGYEHSTQAMSCADGMVYDTTSNSCKTVTG